MKRVDVELPTRGKKNNSVGLKAADCGVFLPARFGCYKDPTVIILLGCAKYKQASEAPHAHGTGEARQTVRQRSCLKECGHPYLVGSAGGVESVCSANKQRVVVLLQEHLDEIVTLVLQKSKSGEKKEREVHLLKGELSL